MAPTDPVRNLNDLLDQLEHMAHEREQINLRDVLHAVGRRSFGPWLLVIGLITLSPIGDIPGVPTLVGAMLLLVAAQLLLRRPHFWLPGWLLRRSVSGPRFRKAVRRLRKPASFVDRFLRARMEFFTGSKGTYVVAILCVVIALGLPPMEFVPFSATGAGIALTAFGLALIANDGLLAAIAALVMATAYGLVGWKLIGE